MLERAGDAQTAVREAIDRSYDMRLWIAVDLALGACAFHLLDTDREGAATVLGLLASRPTSVIGAHIEVRERTLNAVADMADGQMWMANGTQLNRHEAVAYTLSRLAD